MQRTMIAQFILLNLKNAGMIIGTGLTLGDPYLFARTDIGIVPLLQL